MNNFRIDVVSVGKNSLTNFMNAAFPNTKAIGYAIIPEKGMVFFWNKPNLKDFVAFPFTLDAAGCADFAFRWLTETVDYGKEPDHDGDNEKGWRLYNEEWNRVGSWHQSFVAVAPRWAMYGK